MSELTDKEKAIKEVYENNFGNTYEVYKEVVKINTSIRLQDVKDYLSKRDDKQVQLKNTKYNSFVSPKPLFEIEMDVMDLGKSVTNMRYGLVAIDNFTKIVHVVPIQNKTTDEIIKAVKEVFTKIGIPKQIYSDEEGAFNADKYTIFINEAKVNHIQTSTHAPTVERFIRTFRMNLQRRLDALKQDVSNWINHVDNITKKYNNTEHNVIKIKPVEATKKENFFWVAWHLQSNAQRDRKYPTISVNDMVRINRKPKSGITKGYHPKWSAEKYKVIRIEGNDYLINHLTKHKVFHRHELLKV